MHRRSLYCLQRGLRLRFPCVYCILMSFEGGGQTHLRSDCRALAATVCSQNDLDQITALDPCIKSLIVFPNTVRYFDQMPIVYVLSAE